MTQEEKIQMINNLSNYLVQSIENFNEVPNLDQVV